jgi:hypothetical protein
VVWSRDELVAMTSAGLVLVDAAHGSARVLGPSATDIVPSGRWLVAWRSGGRDGVHVYLARELLGIFPSISEFPEFANAYSSRCKSFVVEFNPPRFQIEDEPPLRLAARWEEGTPSELHPIAGFKLLLHAVLEITEVSLEHRRLGEVTYAVGRPTIHGREALLIVTENDGGGQMTLRAWDGRVAVRISDSPHGT